MRLAVIAVLASCKVEDSASFGEIEDAEVHDEIPSILTVRWEMPAAGVGFIEYTFEGEEWLQTPGRFLVAGEQSEMLLGIPFDTEVSYRVVQDVGEGGEVSETFVTRTGALDEAFPLPELIEWDADRTLPEGNYLFGGISGSEGGWGVTGTFWKFILDRKGRVVWAHPTDDKHWSIYPRLSRDGDHLLWDEQTYWSEWDRGQASVVHRARIDLSEESVTATPGLHHVFTELPDETLVYGAAGEGTQETLDLRAPDGTVTSLWDCDEFHAAHEIERGCQSNSLWWSEERDTYLFSFYTTDTVVEIDGQTGQTLRVFGDTIPGSYSFESKDKVFAWQHGVAYTDEGTLLLSTESKTDDGGHETVAREYIVDDKKQALIETWSFGEGEGVYASTAGEAHRLPNGNTLHNYGSSARVREVTATGDVVWDVDWPEDRLLGRTIFIEDLYDFAP